MLHNDIGYLYNSHFPQQTLIRVNTKASWDTLIAHKRR
jgi:hypothetical protein